MDYDTAELLADVQRDAHVPQGSIYADTTALLRFLTKELREKVAPRLINLDGNRLVGETYLSLTGAASYRLPARCLRLEGVVLYDTNGSPSWYFGRFARTDLQKRIAPTPIATYNALPRGWALRDNRLEVDNSASAGRLRLSYRRQPSKLVVTGRCWLATAVTATTVDVAPVNLLETPPVPTANTTLLDFVKATAPWESLLDDAVPTAVLALGGGAYRFTFAEVPGDFAVGDVVCVAGESCFCGLPLAWYGVLVLAGVARVCREMGDSAGEKKALEDFAARMDDAMQTISPAAEEPEAFISSVWT